MSFTPFVTSVDVVLGCEANSLMKLLATKIYLKWEKPLSEVTGWVRARLAFAILRAINLCNRRKWTMGLDYPCIPQEWKGMHEIPVWRQR